MAGGGQNADQADADLPCGRRGERFAEYAGAADLADEGVAALVPYRLGQLDMSRLKSLIVGIESL